MENRKKLILIIGLSLGVLIMLGSAGISYTSKPSFCTSCHEVAPAVAAWETSAHNSVDCLKCHAEPGFIGKVKIKLGAVHEIKAHLFDNLTSEDLKAEVPRERCFSCHAQEDLIKDKPLHEEIVANEEVTCASCHRNAIHPK